MQQIMCTPHCLYYYSNILYCRVPCRTVLFTLTSVVVLVITTDWISWDKLNRGFLPSDEVSRAFLASFILVFDLLIVMQVSVFVFSSSPEATPSVVLCTINIIQ